ncbi:Sec-independent protein translocase protein TatB [Sulfurimonas sp.]|jgi:sec-independent protein translocase protein TatB|uniref:Sec-independent protein translocase protein TatB n=1 Tax=Sulfurimonas sp. TaxID=2022749 RepID=UPI0025F74C89|nr:Sec-independent protein translocase protein TatB [Sulfurimonas sp.]MCK9472420.1 Sec-independent protein translocase protein TatB [Sulfurimonas sp.]MDD3505635.1 Sec-independent protein translocase protein TatB [Sulfurimonas sp.]
MFGMGFTEILIIAVIAILFLGPDKLPSTMVEIAKFFRNTKNTIGSMKQSFEEEINMKSMKDEALAYKKELQNASNQVKSATDIKKMAAKLTTLEDDSFSDEGLFDKPKDESTSKPQEATLTKKKKSPAIDKTEEDNKNV